MQVFDDLAKASLRRESIVTIGAFDGVHRGHQALIQGVVARARATGRLAVLVTFHPHPVMVLAPDRAPRYLTTPGEKLALLETLGIDVTVILRFTRELAAQSAHHFMAALREHLRLRELWVGPDFALGRNREGTVPRLRELGQELGYEVHVVQPVASSPSGVASSPSGEKNGQETISSSRIRDLLGQGRVEEAAELLGRYPSVSGEVVSGAHRGRRLGFPTANLEVRAERAVPANGIYAVLAVLGSERYPGVANVGVRPTFDNGERTIETYIFDFEQDIYGCDLVVEFVARLRDERRFADISELVAQIGRDSDEARRILSERVGTRPPGPAGGGDGPACRYRVYEVEHTADRALRVWGATLADLFIGAARGMGGLMADLTDLVALEWREIHLESWDRESLLVDWLNELLYLGETERLIFVEFDLQSLTDRALTARAGGAPARLKGEEIKAATYHNLVLVHDEKGWSTTITFDV
jgi:riboflavin kinase/FMN adenylyltransferase